MNAILGASPVLHLQVPDHALILPSPSATAPSGPHTVGKLLENVLAHVLSCPVDLDALAHALKPFHSELVGPIGPHISAPLASTFQPNAPPLPVPCSLAAPGPQRSGSDDIAIVGISGRFPGGDDLETFWNVLSSGLDLHREVSFPWHPTMVFC